MYVKIQSKFMESFVDDLNKTMKNITKIFNSNNIGFCFIGGAARNQYGVRKITEDIDILVDFNDKSKLDNISIGFMKDISNGRKKVYKWNDPKTKLKIIYSGEISGDGINGIKYEKPNKLENIKNGFPILSLKNLIEYKLSSGIYGDREKDFADIRDLIRINKLKKDFSKDFREDLNKKFIELWNKEHKSNNFDKQFEI